MKDDNTDNANVKKSRIDENESDSDEDFIYTEADDDSKLSKDKLSDAEEAAESDTTLKASDFEWQSILFLQGPITTSDSVNENTQQNDFDSDFSNIES